MLHIVFPFTGIALLLLVVNVFALAVCLVIHKVSVVCVTVRMRETTLTIGLAITDVTCVGGTVRPVQCTLSMRYEEQVCGRAARFREVCDNVARTLANNFHLTRVSCAIGMYLEILLCN